MFMWQLSGILVGLVIMMLAQIVWDQGLIPHSGTKPFWFANCHLFDPLLHSMANVISQLKMHEDMFSPWKGECKSEQVYSLV